MVGRGKFWETIRDRYYQLDSLAPIFDGGATAADRYKYIIDWWQFVEDTLDAHFKGGVQGLDYMRSQISANVDLNPLIPIKYLADLDADFVNGRHRLTAEELYEHEKLVKPKTPLLE